MSGITITADSGTQFTANAAEWNSICRLDDNTYAIAYRDNNNGNKGTVNVGTRTGTSISITPANATVFYSNSTDLVTVVAMSSTKIAISFQDVNTGTCYCVICTISGTTITVGTPVSETSSNNPSVVALDSSNIVFTAQQSTEVFSYVGSVSGTTISFGTGQVAVSTNAAFSNSVGLDSTHYAVAFEDTSAVTLDARVGTVNTGTQTISFGTTKQGPQIDSTISPVKLAAFDTQHFIICYGNNNAGGHTEGRFIAAEVNLTTDAITFGSEIKTDAGSTDKSNWSLCTVGPSNFLTAYYTTTGTQCEMRGGTLTGSTTIAFDAQGPVVVDNITSAYTALCALTSTDFIIGLKEG